MSDNILYVMGLSGEDGQCGCPICCASTQYCDDVVKSTGYVPNELTGILTEQEYSAFIAEANAILHKSHWPMLPCMFTHFCIPFSPVCAMMACRSHRQSSIKEFLERTNEILRERGLYWELGNVCVSGTVVNNGRNTVILSAAKKTFAVLKVHQVGRAKYEAQHPKERSLMAMFAECDEPLVALQINNTVVSTTTTVPVASPTQSPYPSPSPSYSQPPTYGAPPPTYGAPAPTYGVPQPSPKMSPRTTTGPPPVPTQTSTSFCNQCGNQVPAGSRFCNVCGNQVA